MEPITITAIFIVGLALFFNFTNGFHDSANQIATVIVSRAMKPTSALLTAAIANFIGAYFLGTAVASTIGKDIVNPSFFHGNQFAMHVMAAALASGILWNIITWYFGIPSSSSHALIGGLLGAFLMGWGWEVVQWNNVIKIIIVMLLSPIAGFVLTYIFTWLTLGFSKPFSPKINFVFKKLQIVSSIAQALAHGTNDGQKTMGVITFSLVALGIYSSPDPVHFTIPTWVIIASSLAMCFGTMSGGWRIIKKLGSGLYKIRPIHGFASQSTSSAVIYLASIFGFPLSTTQIISSSVMGAGAAFRPKMVRWFVAQEMLVTWLITIPITAAFSALLFIVLKFIF